MRKIISAIAVLTSTLLLFYSFTLSPIHAKKKIVRSKPATTVSTKTAAGNRLIITPKLRSDKKALNVTFSNLGVVSSFSYELTYTTNGIPQGVAGTVTPTRENSTQRQFLFGTCSRNVCRYNTGIKEMKLVVTSQLNSGQKVRKTFTIKP